jgi:1,4-alpha-glucan branching enzyme
LEVTFALDRAGAGEVLLCGDFSNWCPRPMRMIQQARNDRWEKRLVLPAGRYEYKFIVDGRWTTDPLSTEDRPNTMGSMNSILRVMP